MNILGISAYYHDSAATLLQDAQIVAAAQEERFSRKKHDQSFPSQAIAYCLREGGIGASELDYVAFYEKPFLKFERILETYLSYAPKGVRSFIRAIPLWIKKKLWIKDLIADELDFNGPILFPEHHESHAASAFFPSPFEEAAILTMDGVGEWTTTSYGIGSGNTIQLQSDLQFPHSLGLLYSAFTYYTGFKVNSGEYKVMGLAPYGQAVYADLIKKHLIDIKPDGSFRLNMEYFNYGAGLTMTNRKFHRLFGGKPRKPDTELRQRDMDLARSVQEVAEEVIVKMARHVRRQTGKKNLCLAGGVALNCVANGKILRENIFDNIWIQPAAGDAGGALGAAQTVWYQHLDHKRTAHGRNDQMQGAFLGPSFSNGKIKSYLNEHELPFRYLENDEIAGTVADLIANKKVVGWFQGRMEYGPRALGARSILGDARSPRMQQIINHKIKFRESFRPFAPSVLAEKADEYFEIAADSPYMVLVAPVRESHRNELAVEDQHKSGLDQLQVVRSDIPAVTHVDYTARLQTVHKTTNPRFHQLLTAFNRTYGCPLVVNTSFNVRGEPIVCTPHDAVQCFKHTGMDYLMLGNYLIDKADMETTHIKEIESGTKT